MEPFNMDQRESPTFPWTAIVLLTGVFYLNFTSRVLLAPLLPVIEQDLGLGHGEAGSLFLHIALGYGTGLAASGFVSSRLTHRLTILVSIFMAGMAFVVISRLDSVGAMRIGLVVVGLFAALYIPSGIATITGVARQEHWGRALAVHELGPNLGFITVPWLAEGLLHFYTWRGTLAVLGAASIFMGILYLFAGKGGKERGTPPNGRSMGRILSNPAYWVMASFFVISIGSTVGLYTMIPLFLVNEMGMERTMANTLIGFSRVFGIVVLFLSGFITDRFGPKKAMAAFLLTTGVLTVLFGAFRHPAGTVVLMFLQAASSACLFPVGFTIISLVFPAPLRGVAVSLVMVVGFLLGGGVVPSALGHWAEAFSFSSGFALLGISFLAMLPFCLRVGKRLEV
jgi:NNP family nitrate/nitrite transporter-like MFS transporter